MSNLTRLSNDIKFENDFGQAPIGLGRFVDTPAELAISYGLAGFVGFVTGGFPALLYIAALAANDMQWAGEQNKQTAKNWKESQTQQIQALLGEDTSTAPVTLDDATFRTLTQQQILQQFAQDALKNAAVLGNTAVKNDAPPIGGTPGFIADMGHHIKNTMIIGVPGAGKGLTTANLLKEVRKRHPNTHIVGIDPKNSPKEDGYWSSGYDKVFRFSLANIGSEAGIRELNKALRYFKDFPGEKLLVLDEGLSMMRCLKGDADQLREFNDWLTFLMSMGDSEDIHLWFLSQTGNLKDLGLDSSVRACFDVLAIMTAGNDALMQGLLRTDLMPPGEASNPKKVKAAIADSEIGRAFYFNRIGSWLPMPTLPNLSGYDRDKRAWLPGKEPAKVATPKADVVEEELPALYEAIARMTNAQFFTTETPGTINADGTKEPPEGAADDEAEAEIIRFLDASEEPRLVKEIRNCARAPIKGMASGDIRELLDDMVDVGQIQTDGKRFFI
jgi:hypothetical protein